MKTDIVTISHIAGGYLYVNLLASTDIAFTIAEPDDQTLQDVLAVIWPLMMLDAATAELYDGDLQAYNGDDFVYLMKVQKFYKKYKTRLSNITTDIFELELPLNGH